jgi:hypothetical protein
MAAHAGLHSIAGVHSPNAEVAGLLHLFGNWIFFTGIVAMYIAMRSRGVEPRQMRATRVAFWVQLMHVLEHVSLTSTYLLVGRSIGMSTLLGYNFYLERSLGSSIQIWWHFVINTVVVVAALLALREFRRAGFFTTATPATSTDAPHEAPVPELAVGTRAPAVSGASSSEAGPQ